VTGRLEAAWGGLVPAPVDQWVEQRRAQGLPVIDLTDSCLARQGFEPPQSILEEISAATDKLTDIALYATHSFGRTGAREAIATLHRTEDPPPVESVALLPGSSFGYWALLRLIANPGDNILVPTPGYPLLDDIATLAGVRLRTGPGTASRGGEFRLAGGSGIPRGLPERSHPSHGCDRTP
jgi:aspartate/methionine/tyrosine aminotransferase